MPKKTPQKTAPPVPYAEPRPVATLSKAAPWTFDLRPDTEAQAQIARFLNIEGIQDLRFKGELGAGPDDRWIATGRLTGRAVQSCIVSLDPVEEAIDEQVRRIYVPEDVMAEMEPDLDPDAEDEFDVYTDTIDVAALAVEALALALDPYPRKPGVEVETAQFAAPGTAPLKDEDLKPFAGLAALKEKMSGK